MFVSTSQKTSDGSIHFQQSQPIHYSPDSLAQTDHEGSRDLAILESEATQVLPRPLLHTPGPHQSQLLRRHHRLRRLRLDSTTSNKPYAPMPAHPARPPSQGFSVYGFSGFRDRNGSNRGRTQRHIAIRRLGNHSEDCRPPKSLKSLKIQRRFNNSYFHVNFKRRDKNILGLTLSRRRPPLLVKIPP